MRKRMAIFAVALAVGASPALALDGQVGVGLVFDHKGVRPFAGMEGGVSDRSGVYDGSWISGPSASGSAGAGGGLSGVGESAGPTGGLGLGTAGGTVGGAIGGAGALTLR